MLILTAEAERTAAAEGREARAHAATYGRLPRWPQGIRSCMLRLHPVPSNIGVSRDFAANILGVWDSAGWSTLAVADEIKIMVSEFMTNAIQATNQLNVSDRWLLSCRLVLTVRGVSVEVTDRSPYAPVIREPDDEAEGGRGLRIIDEFTDGQWGWVWIPNTAGKLVWGEIKVLRKNQRPVSPNCAVGT